MENLEYQAQIGEFTTSFEAMNFAAMQGLTGQQVEHGEEIIEGKEAKWLGLILLFRMRYKILHTLGDIGLIVHACKIHPKLGGSNRIKTNCEEIQQLVRNETIFIIKATIQANREDAPNTAGAIAYLYHLWNYYQMLYSIHVNGEFRSSHTFKRADLSACKTTPIKPESMFSSEKFLDPTLSAIHIILAEAEDLEDAHYIHSTLWMKHIIVLIQIYAGFREFFGSQVFAREAEKYFTLGEISDYFPDPIEISCAAEYIGTICSNPNPSEVRTQMADFIDILMGFHEAMEIFINGRDSALEGEEPWDGSVEEGPRLQTSQEPDDTDDSDDIGQSFGPTDPDWWRK